MEGTNPNGIIWAVCCGWMLLPIVIAFVAYRWMMRLGQRRLTVVHTQEKGDGRILNRWDFDIDEKAVPVVEAEEPKND